MKKYILAVAVSLAVSFVTSYLSVNYQKAITVEACLQTKYCPGEYAEINFGGFPIQFTYRADINSPANYANFNDGWSLMLFIANTSVYFLIFLILALLIKRKISRF
jgi:hypothetical protein